MPDRPVAGQLEERALPIEVDGRRLRGVIPYGVESRDLGGWTEVIDPAALRRALLDDLVVTVEHAGVPLGRYPRTLEIEERADGLHWSVEPPRSRADIIEAVERGDLRAGSWRMRVARERWEGDVRHVLEIAELRDVALTSSPAYPNAAVELRSAPEEEPTMPVSTPPEAAPVADETRSAPEGPGLPVEAAAAYSRPRRGLTDEFRFAGFPGERAVLPFERVFEQRALTITDTENHGVAPVRTAGVPLGADSRWLWPAFPRVTVDAGTTSVDVLRQTARTLASAANVVRAIDAVTDKPETSSTVEIVAAALRQVATVSTGIPNVYLESQAINAVIESDLRLAVNGGLDKLVLDALATAGHEDPTTVGLLAAIRGAITTVEGVGYAPDTLVLSPAAAETLDLLKVDTDTEQYVFPPARGVEGTIFGLRPRVAKGAAAPIVLDSQAVGRLYVAPVSLARFEENAGSTNTSTVRLETHALFNVERIDAAVRVAAS